MTYRVAVCYGRPTDPEAFDKYYNDIHIPLVRAVPGLSGFTFSTCSSMDGSDPVFYAVANLVFPDLETMQSGLKSPEMRAAGKDVANFATGKVDMYVQEVVSVL
ncbi:EthD family reductase [Rhodococcus sp. IEGM 1409]|uniref:EthD family reductase n=1 Tax=Rhodococcus sp. IEGM 1409 TaxID=3047082 RepID=UPI0024B80869|nr:EthD family reductase [Rhodococcus sp. IEGM 1409]MDI9901838.1 EthD family reductase [Rhodococcus sp. IEGM 1409]